MDSAADTGVAISILLHGDFPVPAPVKCAEPDISGIFGGIALVKCEERHCVGAGESAAAFQDRLCLRDRDPVNHAFPSPSSGKMRQTVGAGKLGKLKTCRHHTFQPADLVPLIPDNRPTFHQRAVIPDPVNQSYVELLQRVRKMKFQNLASFFRSNFRILEQRLAVPYAPVHGGDFQSRLSEQSAVPSWIFLPHDTRPLSGSVEKIANAVRIRKIGERSDFSSPVKIHR